MFGRDLLTEQMERFRQSFETDHDKLAQTTVFEQIFENSMS